MTEGNVLAGSREGRGALGVVFEFPLMISYALGFLSTVFLPVWTGAMASRFGVSVSHLGFIASLELGSVAVASVLTAAFLDTRRFRWPVVLSLLISIAANLLSAVAPSVGLFRLARIVSGLANGFLMADVSRRAAETAVPSRVFAGQIFVMVAFAVVFFSNAPRLLASWGPGAPFFYCTAVAVIALLSVPALRINRCASNVQAATIPFVISVGAVLMLAAPTLLFMTNNGVWTYLVPSASHAGVGLKRLSTLLAVGALFNLAAPVASGWLAAGRLSPALALTAGICAFAACVFFVTGAGQWLLFSAGALFEPFFVMFVVPFYLTLLVKLDRSGKCVAASGAFFMAGGAVGPGIGGVVIDYSGLSGLAFGGIAAATLALALTWLGLARGANASST